MKIVFMGTPDFAVPSLEALIASSHEVVLVVTGPDKPRGRGRRLLPTPVKTAAERAQIPVYQPANLKSDDVLERLQESQAELYVVVAFRILPEGLISLPESGVINLHGSMLPAYRGAAPIQWALLNGDRVTGVTTFFIEVGVDTGDIILQKELAIDREDNAGTLHDRMAVIGAETVVATVDLIAAGKAPRKKQVGTVSKAPKITREMCRLDWHDGRVKLVNQIRAFSPFPGAFTHLGGQIMKIFDAKPASSQETAKPAQLRVKDQTLQVGCGDGWLELREVQLEGKRRMPIAHFLRGIDPNKLESGFK